MESIDYIYTTFLSAHQLTMRYVAEKCNCTIVYIIMQNTQFLGGLMIVGKKTDKWSNLPM